jgi:hypothetical protein
LQYSWNPSNFPPQALKLKKIGFTIKNKKGMVRHFVHFEVLCTAKYHYGEKFYTVQLNSISVREIRHQRINNYLNAVIVRGKITGLGPRYMFISGLPT